MDGAIENSGLRAHLVFSDSSCHDNFIFGILSHIAELLNNIVGFDHPWYRNLLIRRKWKPFTACYTHRGLLLELRWIVEQRLHFEAPDLINSIFGETPYVRSVRLLKRTPTANADFRSVDRLTDRDIKAPQSPNAGMKALKGKEDWNTQQVRLKWRA